mgnify:CR=1 FL=1
MSDNDESSASAGDSKSGQQQNSESQRDDLTKQGDVQAEAAPDELLEEDGSVVVVGSNLVTGHTTEHTICP